MYVPDDDNYVVDGENYAPVRPEDKKTSKGRFPVKKVIIIVCAIIFGVVVYFVSDMIFNGSSRDTNDTPNLATTLSVDDPEVESLYEMVTYGRDDSTLNKYLKEPFVRAEDFSNYEKFYYSFSGLVNRDLEEVEDGTYAISESTVDQLMQDYFGDDISYLKRGEIPIVLSSSLDQGNTLLLSYQGEDVGFTTSISTTEEVQSRVIPVYMSELESATRDGDGVITLTERVIYLTSEQTGNSISYRIYRDYDHTMLLDSRENVSLSDYQNNPISIDDYMNTGNVVTYQFQQNDDGNYYFYQSSIEE